MSIPTHEDARLVIELFRLRLDPFLQESETWFLTRFEAGSWGEIKARYPYTSKEWRMLSTVLGYWEMLGALIDHNLLSSDLLFDVIESVDVSWEKVTAWLPDARAEMGADLWENVELLVTRLHKWRYTRTPKSQRA